MASYAPNFTARLKLFYNHLGVEYSALWRYRSAETSPSILAGDLASFYGQFMSIAHTDFAFTRVEYSNEGDDFFLPIDIPAPLAALTPTGPTTTGSNEFRAVALNFNGKTLTGNPWRCYVYGLSVDALTSGVTDIRDNYRITRAESPIVDAACAELQALAATGNMIGNDAVDVVAIYGYANVTLNKYRIRRARRG